MPIIDLGRVVGRDGEDGAPGSGGSSLPNLLDNSNFKKPINQRGVSGTISAAGYFIDRWKLVSGSVTIETGGLMLNGEIAQILESAPLGDVTAAASAGTASFDAGTNCFSLTASGELIEWAGLYEGEYEAGMLPAYVPKSYSVELLECLRYYYPLKTSMPMSGYIAESGSIYLTVTQAVQMRCKPSIKTGMEIALICGGKQISANTYDVYSYGNYGVKLRILKDNHTITTTKTTVGGYINSDGYLSADL